MLVCYVYGTIRSSTNAAGYGGAISATGGGSIYMRDCDFTGNQATGTPSLTSAVPVWTGGTSTYTVWTDDARSV